MTHLALRCAWIHTYGNEGDFDEVFEILDRSIDLLIGEISRHRI